MSIDRVIWPEMVSAHPAELNKTLLRDLYCSYLDDHYSDFMHEYYSGGCDGCEMLIFVRMELRRQGIDVPEIPSGYEEDDE